MERILGKCNSKCVRYLKKLQQQTKSVSNVWKDDQFKKFEAEFNQTIVKNMNEATIKMELMSNYVKKIVEFHRQAQNQKIY